MRFTFLLCFPLKVPAYLEFEGDFRTKRACGIRAMWDWAGYTDIVPNGNALIVGELSGSHVSGILDLVFRLLAFFTKRIKLAQEKDERIEKYCK